MRLLVIALLLCSACPNSDCPHHETSAAPYLDTPEVVEFGGYEYALFARLTAAGYDPPDPKYLVSWFRIEPLDGGPLDGLKLLGYAIVRTDTEEAFVVPLAHGLPLDPYARFSFDCGPAWPVEALYLVVVEIEGPGGVRLTVAHRDVPVEP